MQARLLYFTQIYSSIPSALAIRARNSRLLDDEDGTSAGRDSRPTKRKKTTTTPALSDDEEAMASTLQSIQATAALARLSGDEMSEEENGPRNAGDDEDLNVELDGVDIDDVDVEMDPGSTDGDLSNEVCEGLFYCFCLLTSFHQDTGGKPRKHIGLVVPVQVQVGRS